MPSTEAWTIQRLIDWTSDYLKKHDSDSPQLEARILLAFALHLTKIELYTHFDMVPDDKALKIFRELVKRRGQGEPVAYLIGQKEFYSLEFEVNSSVLIPRPETELLVLEAIEYLKKKPGYSENRFELCDLGTGSGIIAITLARELIPVHITAIDISDRALTVAVKNSEKHQVSDKIVFLKSDLFSALSSGTCFDLILSNPPYVSASEYESLPVMVRNYEPREALLAGPTGCEVLETIANTAPSFLKKDGAIIMELSPMISAAVVDFMEKSGLWTDIHLIKDGARLERFVFAAKK